MPLIDERYQIVPYPRLGPPDPLDDERDAALLSSLWMWWRYKSTKFVKAEPLNTLNGMAYGSWDTKTGLWDPVPKKYLRVGFYTLSWRDIRSQVKRGGVKVTMQ